MPILSTSSVLLIYDIDFLLNFFIIFIRLLYCFMLLCCSCLTSIIINIIQIIWIFLDLWRLFVIFVELGCGCGCSWGCGCGCGCWNCKNCQFGVIVCKIFELENWFWEGRVGQMERDGAAFVVNIEFKGELLFLLLLEVVLILFGRSGTLF